MSKMNPKVDAFLKRAKQWQQETKKLRTIILGCHLAEELKWGQPCYTLEGKNIVLIQGFKQYCALLFFKGALLKDAKGILARIGQHTQAGRQIRFTSVRDVIEMQPTVKAYIDQAIAVEKSGLKVKLKKAAALSIPEELQHRLDEIPALKTAFDALTPGRQRAYIFYFSAGKQSKTRAARVDKCMPQILSGKGLND